MSQQQPNDPKPDPAEEIIHKSGDLSGQQASQDSQQRRDAHSNSAAAGSEAEYEDSRERSRNSPT